MDLKKYSIEENISFHYPIFIDGDMDASTKICISGIIVTAFTKFEDLLSEIRKFIIEELKKLFNVNYSCNIMDSNPLGYYYDKKEGTSLIFKYRNYYINIYLESDIQQGLELSQSKEEMDEKDDDFEIVDCDMDDKMKGEILMLIGRTGREHGNNMELLVEKIKENLETQFSGLWSVLYFLYKDYCYNIRYAKGYKLFLRVNNMYLMIYKELYHINSNDFNYCNSEPKIVANQMNEQIKNFCLSTVIKVVDKNSNKTPQKNAIDIVDIIEKKYGKYWICFIIEETKGGGFKIQFRTSYYLNFLYKGFQYIIYQTP